jgi:hypothetical protein
VIEQQKMLAAVPPQTSVHKAAYTSVAQSPALCGAGLEWV